IDQAIAKKIGIYTSLPSLELGIDHSSQAGACDSTYSCAYSSNISWRTPNTPMSKEINPKSAFDRMFTKQNTEPVGKSLNQSILDHVLE
ncbi:DUF1552 domain-containing protein, partial [Lacticaseibacillus paracasei]